MEEITALKEKGNRALSELKFDEAITAYTEALRFDDTNYVLYSNRSAAHARAGCYVEALQDAERTIELNYSWAKGYSRKGAALTGLRKYKEAYEAYQKGLEFEPKNPSLLKAQHDIEQTVIDQLISQKEDVTQSKYGSNQHSLATDMSEQNSENLSDFKRLAMKEKELGNVAYKKKDFVNALKHYRNATEYNPTDITFYSNIAAVYFEQQDYQKCINECEKGIEIGRENRADFKLIAKAFARIANAFKKMGDWKSAKTYYEKAMSEHRTPEIKTMLSEVEKKIKEEERKAYTNPEKAEEEKEIGNDLFKKGDYSTAIKHYSEAIKRNPEDPKLYSNRAACYTKLAAFDLGLKDCETCIKLDEKFIKGYIRKGKVLQGMQQSSKALAAYQKALEIDPNNAEALEGYRSCSVAFHSNPQEIWKNAMADPEVQQILKDPAMRMILEQMQSDPNAVKEHLKNPAIADKIYKLLESGIIQIH